MKRTTILVPLIFLAVTSGLVSACSPKGSEMPVVNHAPGNRGTDPIENQTGPAATTPQIGNQAASQNTGTGAVANQTGNGESTQALPGLSRDWPLFGNNLWQDRFSPDTSITPQSAVQLKVAFNIALPHSDSGNEAYPIESNGVLYVTTRYADVIAVNALSGKVLWTFLQPSYDSKLPQMNRGVALYHDKVYVLTNNDHLIALQQSDGHIVFNVPVANPSTGVFESMAPLAANGKVFVGSSGGDEGVRGFVAAYDANTGKKLWQFDTVPERGQGWLPASGAHGGGAVWTTPTYDTSTHSLYFGTGNPSPDYYGVSRPGPDPYTDSVVRLNAENGTLRFAKQEVSHDLWDYDVASPPLLFTIHGRQVVGEAGKDGEWYEWYTDNGLPVIQPTAFVKIQHTPPTPSGVLEWPGPDGGANYGPSAYDPQTKEVFIAGINGPETLYASPTNHSGHFVDLGTSQNPAPADKWSGTITAVDVQTGQVDWQVKTATPPIGGVTVSAGGIVWYGEANGTLTGRSVTDGKIVFEQQLHAPIGSAPILYERNGQTYLCVVTGGATSLKTLFPYHGPAHVIGFKLPD